VQAIVDPSYDGDGDRRAWRPAVVTRRLFRRLWRRQAKPMEALVAKWQGGARPRVGRSDWHRGDLGHARTVSTPASRRRGRTACSAHTFDERCCEVVDVVDQWLAELLAWAIELRCGGGDGLGRRTGGGDAAELLLLVTIGGARGGKRRSGRLGLGQARCCGLNRTAGRAMSTSSSGRRRPRRCPRLGSPGGGLSARPGRQGCPSPFPDLSLSFTL
jgi:hypothetical protein